MSDYAETYHLQQPKERPCGILHSSIQEAIVHAEHGLDSYHKPMVPYRGTTRETEGVIVGFAR
jgi:hypothetical protein